MDGQIGWMVAGWTSGKPGLFCSMKCKVRVTEPEPGQYVAVWLEETDCVARGRSREEALKKVRDEIQFRIELCPCSGQVMGIVEVEAVE